MFMSAGADPYCIVKCGRSKAETPVKKNTLNPNFSASVQFFVSNPGSAEVTVEVSYSQKHTTPNTMHGTQCTHVYM
jgi:Ca2+-dependent lipid-binding protein